MQEESKKRREYAPGLYGRVYLASLQDSRVKSLSNAAFRAYIAITATACGQSESDAYTAHLLDLLGWSDGYLRAAVRELVAAGLIERQVNRAAFGSDGHHPNRWILLGVQHGRWAVDSAPVDCAPGGAVNSLPGGAVDCAPPTPVHSVPAHRIHSQDPFPGSTHTGAVDKPSGEAARLVEEWLLVQKITRKPFISEVTFAKKVLSSYETTDEAYHAVRSAMLLLEQRGLLAKTLTFNGLKMIFGET